MLHRRTNSGLMLMSQPAHAWVSGQMARAWADGFEPRVEIVLAAEQHDAGWTDWEQRPSFNAQTGWPHGFMEMETSDHLAIWSGASQPIESMSAFAALLVSRHGTGLYERFHQLTEMAEMEPDVRAYLEGERATQQRLIEKLRRGHGWDGLLSDAALDRTSRLIAAWDWMSLIVCINESERGEVADVPWGAECINLEIRRQDEARWMVSPWPFVGDELTVVAEGRMMERPAGSEAEMRSMLAAADLVRVEIVLARS